MSKTAPDTRMRPGLFLTVSAALLVLCGTIFMTAFSQAQTSSAKDSMKEFVFDKNTNSAYTLTQARKYYEAYLKNMGVNPKSQKSLPAYARTIPLDPGSPGRFVAFYTMGGLGGDCPALGCNIMVFDTTDKKSPAVVLNIYAHRLFIGEAETGGIPAPLYLQSFLQGGAAKRDGQPQKWIWKDGKYQNAKKSEGGSR